MSVYNTLIPVPSITSINTGLNAAKVSTLTSIFGAFEDMPVDCGEVGNAKIRALLVTGSVGPFRVTGLKPAVQSLQRIFTRVLGEKPDLYHLTTTEGMLCWRRVRNASSSTPSNHSSGCAIDLAVGGVCPEQGAQMIPQGFKDLYPYFHAEGWFWGLGYHTGISDPMHMECADETLKKWHNAGII